MPCYEPPGLVWPNFAKPALSTSRLESLLCSACKMLAEYRYDFDKNPLLSEWWDTHQKEDIERERNELIKKIGEMKKLEELRQFVKRETFLQ